MSKDGRGAEDVKEVEGNVYDRRVFLLKGTIFL